MTSDDKPEQQFDISPQDLQLLLRPKLGPSLAVLGCEISSLLPPGENFACSISKLSCRVRRDEDKEEEQLHLVAKSFPTAEYIQTVFDFSAMFTKEIFFYERLLPAYKQLELDFGVEEVLVVAPEIYGVRKSRGLGEGVDESVVLLLENLKEGGYYTLDKVEGLDLSHSKLAIKSLARFHALGIACRQHRPSFWTDVTKYASIESFKAMDSTAEMVAAMFDMMLKDPRIAAHGPKLAKFMDSNKLLFNQQEAPAEPWISLAHCDFWTNNILYRKDEDGNLAGVKFIDFQNYLCNSPLKDLPYFLCSSTSHEVMTRHLDELLDLYYETLVEVLRRMRCDVTAFSRKAFDQQLKIDAKVEFFHNILAIKFFCAEIDKSTYEPSQLESVVLTSEINKIGYDKWHQIVLTYIEQGWI